VVLLGIITDESLLKLNAKDPILVILPPKVTEVS
jgi:hypothetical protein